MKNRFDVSDSEKRRIIGIHRDSTKRLYLKEQREDIKLSELVDGEIRIYVDNIRNLLNFVGGGVSDIDVNSTNLSGKWLNFNKDEYQNEVFVRFYDNAWGGIDHKEWNRVENKLKKYIGIGGLESVSINTSMAVVTMEFSNEHEMAEY